MKEVKSPRDSQSEHASGSILQTCLPLSTGRQISPQENLVFTRNKKYLFDTAYQIGEKLRRILFSQPEVTQLSNYLLIPIVSGTRGSTVPNSLNCHFMSRDLLTTLNACILDPVSPGPSERILS